MAKAVNNREARTKAEDISVLEVSEWTKTKFNKTVATKFKGKLKSNSSEIHKWREHLSLTLPKKVKQIFRTFLLLTDHNINWKRPPVPAVEVPKTKWKPVDYSL